ncbi:MAG: 50S ribosomal protein L17 [Proteobacteria bacterium]|nr:50S ribosomal protein L17 [Pseudomonadota bacterium]
MNHCKKGRKFGRYSAHRLSMMRNLATSLVAHEKIITTVPKAKDLRSVVEKMITIAKGGTLHDRRRLISMLGDKPEVVKLMDVLAARYQARNGGYTRVIKAGFRQGDCAPIAMIELVDRPAA